MISWKAISQGCRSRQPSRKRARTSPSLAQRKGEGIRTGLVKSEEFKFVLQLKGSVSRTVSRLCSLYL